MQLSAAAQLQQGAGFPNMVQSSDPASAHTVARTAMEANTRTPSPPAEGHGQPDDGATSHNTIFPRRKAGERTRVNSKPVVLNDTVLRQLFTVPLHEAAVRLGISATAMKSACRKLGIKKWPYRSSYGLKNGSASARSQASNLSSAMTSPVMSPMARSQASSSAGDNSKTGSTNSDNSSEDSEDRDSLSRDAALLAETMLMLQRGSYNSGSAAGTNKIKKRAGHGMVKDVSGSLANSDERAGSETSLSSAPSCAGDRTLPAISDTLVATMRTNASAAEAKSEGHGSVASLLN